MSTAYWIALGAGLAAVLALAAAIVVLLSARTSARAASLSADAAKISAYSAVASRSREESPKWDVTIGPPEGPKCPVTVKLVTGPSELQVWSYYQGETAKEESAETRVIKRFADVAQVALAIRKGDQFAFTVPWPAGLRAVSVTVVITCQETDGERRAWGHVETVTWPHP